MAKKKKKAAKKLGKKDASGLTVHQSGGDEATTNADVTRALPAPQARVEDVDVLRSVIEGISRDIVQKVTEGLQEQLHGSDQAAQTSALAQPADKNAMETLLANTSEIRERDARLEQKQEQILKQQNEILSRVAVLEKNQRPPEPAPDREGAIRTAMGRWMLANQCRALNHTRPTPAIVGRVMSDERAFDQRTAKSPQELFRKILDSVVAFVFELAAPQPDQEAACLEQDYVHLTEEIVRVIEERSSIPKKKQAVFLNDQLKPRLNLLVNSGLAEIVPEQAGERTNYSRFLTPMGREIFSGWPKWGDRSGGIGFADEQMPPDLNATGRPAIGETEPLESQPASRPLQHSSQPPPAEPPTSRQPPPPSPT